MRWLKTLFLGLSQVVAFNQLPRDQRRIVFYSEGPTYWTHLKSLLLALLDTDQEAIVYISSDADDPGLQLNHPRLATFLIDEGAIRNWLFANIDTDVMVMTMPDLDQYQVKRSSYGVHYIYTQHSLVSFHMVYRPGAFDAFDTVFCSGPHHMAELRAIEKKRGLQAKRLVSHGYSRLDDILMEKPEEGPDANTILIAPSWGPHSITDTIAPALIARLLACNYTVIFRPHPQSQKFSAPAINDIVEQFSTHDAFEIEMNVASKASLYRSCLMICDWSGAALDYAFGLEKPVLFVDVPRKINNPDYDQIEMEPFEVAVRGELGTVMPVDDVAQVDTYIRQLLSQDQAATIRASRERNVYNVGKSHQLGAAAILDILRETCGD